MGILFNTLTTEPERRAELVRDAEKVLDAEVSDKRGIAGIAVKGTFKVVKNLQPGFVPRTVDDLLNDFVGAIEPIWEAWCASEEDSSCKAYFVANAGAVADALLDLCLHVLAGAAHAAQPIKARPRRPLPQLRNRLRLGRVKPSQRAWPCAPCAKALRQGLVAKLCGKDLRRGLAERPRGKALR